MLNLVYTIRYNFLGYVCKSYDYVLLTHILSPAASFQNTSKTMSQTHEYLPVKM